MTRQLEHVLGADAPSTRQRTSSRFNLRPSLSEFKSAPDHAASRPSPRSCGNGMTLPVPLPEAPSITLPERPARRFAATSSSSSASSDTASSYCAAVSGTRRGGNNLISPLAFFFANRHRGRQRSTGRAQQIRPSRKAEPTSPYIERPFRCPRSDMRDGPPIQTGAFHPRKITAGGKDLQNPSIAAFRVGHVSAPCQRTVGTSSRPPAPTRR